MYIRKTKLICNKEHHKDYVMTRMTNVEGKKVAPNLVRNLECYSCSFVTDLVNR